MKNEPAKFIKRFKQKQKKHDASLPNLPSFVQYSSNLHIQMQPNNIKNVQSTDLNEISKQDLLEFTVVAMLRNQIFCIYSQKLGMFGVVDQHAMHERIRYEYYSKILRREPVSSFISRSIQKHKKREQIQVIGSIKYPKLLHIMKTQYTTLFGKTIDKFGIVLSIDETGEVYMTHDSFILGKRLDDGILKTACMELLILEHEKSGRIPHSIDQILAESACKSAIKFGDQISRQWCMDMLHNATLCDFPWKCVHGRTTVYFQKYSVDRQRVYEIE